MRKPLCSKAVVMIATVTYVSTRTMLKACADRGVDAVRLLADTGIARRLVDEPGARIRLEQVFKLWDEARPRRRNEALALHTAESLPFGSYRLLTTWPPAAFLRAKP